MMHDLIIIGGGPAGVTGAVYAARKKLKTVFITPEFGGQSTVSDDIQNWIGTPHISGASLAKSFEDHVREYEGENLTIDVPTKAASVTKEGEIFTVTTDKDTVYQARAVLYAAGSVRRKLPATGADKYEHKGLTYCATCDGPLFSGQDVLVVGGGNAGFETAAQLLEYTQSVTLLEYADTFKADDITVEKVTAHPNMSAIANVEIKEVLGEQFVNAVRYINRTTNKETVLPVTGIFVEIGAAPNTDMLADFGVLNDYKQIEIDPWTQKTNVPGLWAAGDCTNIRYHQNNIAAGDATKALEDIYATLKTR